jgi:hypothetical protein
VRHRIYVPLRDDPTALCESDAVAAGDGRFRLVGRAPARKRLLYKRGEIVECDIRAVPGGSTGLVATRSVSADPEFRKTRNVFAVSGAIVGAVLGIVVALWVDTSLISAAIGGVLGALTFAYCSIRWGDAAWELLSRALEWP